MKKVRIVIICGCLEDGKDGVGDYSIRIGEWLQAHGVDVQYIAVNDSYVDPSGDLVGKLKRLSSSDTWENRFREIQSVLDSFNPTFIFLQYVPYAFSKKGIPNGFVRLYGQLKSEASRMAMIHESYIDGDLSVKDRLISHYQKKALKRLLTREPKGRVFTSTKKYQAMLQRIGVKSEILPLFGNIPFAERSEPKQIQTGTKRGIYFGAPPKKENFLTFSNGLNHASERFELELKFCGRPTRNSEAFVEHLKNNCSKVQIVKLGEMDAQELSKTFFASDFGVSRIAPDLIGKSGASIAMLEHGLKLWVPLAKSKQEIDVEVGFRRELCFASFDELAACHTSFAPESNLTNAGQIILKTLEDN